MGIIFVCLTIFCFSSFAAGQNQRPNARLPPSLSANSRSEAGNSNAEHTGERSVFIIESGAANATTNASVIPTSTIASEIQSSSSVTESTILAVTSSSGASSSTESSIASSNSTDSIPPNPASLSSEFSSSASSNISSVSSSSATSSSASGSSDVGSSASSSGVASSSSTIASSSNTTIASSSSTTIASSSSTIASSSSTIAASSSSTIAASSSSTIASGSSTIGVSSIASSSDTTSSIPLRPVGTVEPATRPHHNLPGLPVLPTNETVPLLFVAKGTYVKTSASEKACKQNQDCYNMREPDEWCPLPDTAKYGDKGCFCDHLRNVCAIQRQSDRGEEYTDCADKSSSGCSGLKPVVRIQHNK